MSKVTWKKIKKVQKDIENGKLSCDCASDVVDIFGTNNMENFPKDFDRDDLNEDLNTCNICNVLVNTWEELYWQGSCKDSYYECMEGYDAICDDCFDKLYKEFRNKPGYKAHFYEEELIKYFG
tara:strand:+ start:291 stop:659 length:369 start_codon:yes stop_codon:yes gene_type:complete